MAGEARECMLDIRDAAYRYPSGSDVFEHVSFTVDRGEIVSILGPNGAGKSTLLTCVAGLFDLHKGEILLKGTPMHAMKMEDVAKLVGFVPQNHYPTFDYTVEEFVLLGRSPHIGMLSSPGEKDREIAAASIAEMGLQHFRGRIYTQLSGGERQLVLIARALCQQPQILLLDEPTAHLDYGNQIRMLKLVERLRDSGYTILMTTHFPDHVFMCCDKVVIIKDKGLFACGRPEEVMTEKTLLETYGVPVFLRGSDVQKREICIPDYDGL